MTEWSQVAGGEEVGKIMESAGIESVFFFQAEKVITF